MAQWHKDVTVNATVVGRVPLDGMSHSKFAFPRSDN